MTPSPDFLAGVRAGLAAAAKVATDRAAYARKQAQRHGVHTMASEPWTEAAESFEDISAAIRSIDPTTVGGDHG